VYDREKEAFMPIAKYQLDPFIRFDTQKIKQRACIQLAAYATRRDS